VDHHPAETDLAPLPEWLLQRLTKPRIVAAGPIIGSAYTDWESLAGKPVPEGKRNDTIARVSGLLLRRDLPAYLALDLMQGFNLYRCRPPLDPDEVTGIVDSVAKCELRRRGAAS
jgi:hypothetical protein